MPQMPSPHFAAGGRYVMDNVSFGAMMVSEQVRKPLDLITQQIAVRARVNTAQSSGHAADDPHPGQLAAGYKAEKGPIVVVRGQTGEPGPRITNRVWNRVRYAAAHEFGPGGHSKGRGSRDLRRAATAFGDLWGTND